MLPSAHRMRRSSDFTSVVRRGHRAGARHLVVHQLRDLDGVDRPALAGLVVSKAVGNSVTRHRVSRRLRGLLSERVATLPTGSGTVVRALPLAGTASSAALAADLDRAVRVLSRRPERTR